MIRILAILVAVWVGGLAQAQDSYHVKPGDVLRIEVLEDATMNRNALVLPDGTISVPQAGVIAAGGRTVSQIQADLTAKLEPSFAAQPTVFVGVDTLGLAPKANGPTATRTISVYMMGEAAKPGKYDVKAGSTLLQVLAETGGFTKFAATKRLQLRRGTVVYVFNYQAIEQGVSGAEAMVMKPGDVIIVPQRRLFE